MKAGYKKMGGNEKPKSEERDPNESIKKPMPWKTKARGRICWGGGKKSREDTRPERMARALPRIKKEKRGATSTAREKKREKDGRKELKAVRRTALWEKS